MDKTFISNLEDQVSSNANNEDVKFSSYSVDNQNVDLSESSNDTGFAGVLKQYWYIAMIIGIIVVGGIVGLSVFCYSVQKKI